MRSLNHLSPVRHDWLYTVTIDKRGGADPANLNAKRGFDDYSCVAAKGLLIEYGFKIATLAPILYTSYHRFPQKIRNIREARVPAGLA